MPYPSTAIRKCALLSVISLLLSFSFLKAQVVAGIMANGRIINQGDTVNVCAGNSIRYESAASGSLVISWRFNNGIPATATGIGPINVAYNTPGYDTTFQRVDGSAGFADSMFIIVRVSDIKPAAAFTFTPNNQCGNIPVVFTNGSTGDAPLTYHWDFADNSSSTAIHPIHQFLSAVGVSGTQTFPVKLVVTNPLGCKDSVTHPVTVQKIPDASIDNAASDVSFGTFNGIPTFKHCANEAYFPFQFINSSSTTSIHSSYTIKWGDGSPDSTFASWPAATIITHTFPKGSSTMTLLVTGTNGCIGIKEYNVFLGSTPSGGLGSLGNEDICSSQPLSFNINDVSNNPPGTQYIFYVNDGTPSQVFQHPPPASVSHFFATGSCGISSSNGSVTYNNAYAAYLTITNPCGSKSPSVVPIYVSGKPRASISIPAPVVCVNTNVPITSTSVFGNAITIDGSPTSSCSNTGKLVWEISPATGYTLVSGTLGSFNGNPTNGAVWTSGSNGLNIRFTTPGVYTFKLTVYNDRCGFVSTTRSICVRNPPQAAFTLPQHRSCGPATMTLTNTSPIGGCQGDNYQWEIVYDNPQNCPGTGPTYTYTSGGASAVSPTVNFNRGGRYIIRLTTIAVNAFTYCTRDTKADTFYVTGPPVATMPAIPGVCVGNTVTPSANVLNCYSAGPFSYQWTFANGSPATSASLTPGAIAYATAGTHAVQFIVKDEGCGLSDTVNTTVVIGNKPAAEAGTDAEICSGTSIPIGMTPVNGVVYSWTPATGLSSTTISNPTATLVYNGINNDTTYTIYLTASQGSNCSSLDSIKIKVKRKPVVQINPSSAAICKGDTIVLTATGAVNYTWSPGGTLSATNTPAVEAWPANTTTYTVTGDIGNGCPDSKTITVTVRDKPVAEAGNNQTVCSGDPVSVGMSPASGITYSWTPATGLSSATIANPTATLVYNGINDDTTYTYYVTAALGSFCSAIDSVKILVKKKPVLTLSPLAADLCAGDTIVLSAGGATTYSWTPAATLSAPDQPIVQAWPAVTTTYTVTGSISNGCFDRKSSVITVRSKPIAEAGPDRNICSGTPTTIGSTPATGISYQWTPATGLSSSTVANPSLTLSYTGAALDTVYTFYVTASLGSYCSTMDSVKVTVRKKPLVTVSPASAIICRDESVSLTAAGAETYTWLPATGLGSTTGPTVTATPTVTTTYTVTGSLSNNCTDSRSVTVTVSSHAHAEFSASSTTLCAPVLLSGVITPVPSTQNSSYSWYADGILIGTNTTGAFPAYTMSNPGDTIIIKLVAQSAAGCKADSMSITFITRPAIQADFTKDKADGCSPLTVTFTNTTPVYTNTQYQWNFGNGVTSNAYTPPIVTYLASPLYRDTTYYITLSANNGCVTTVKRDSVKVYPHAQARFSVNNPSGCSPFTAVFTNNSRGNNTSYYWDFGDGSVDTTHSTGTLSHVYNTGTIRTYTVRLIAENRCERDTQTINLLVSPNTIQVHLQANGNQLAGCAPHTVTFNNASVGAAQLIWNFGDGSPQVTTPNDQVAITHTFLTSGTYIVKIRLQNNCSDTLIERTVEVYAKPSAAFAVLDPIACPGSVMRFTNQSQNADGYRWSWGDGQESTSVNGQHAYAAAGNYEVILVAYKTHPAGFTCTDTARHPVVVKEKIPAHIDPTANKPCAPFAFTATAAGAASASLAEWFVSNTANPQQVNYYTGTSLLHTFTDPGIFTIKLIVHTAPGCKDSTTYQVTVYASPQTSFAPLLVTTCNHDTTVSFTAGATYTGSDPLQYKWFVNGAQEGTGNPYAHRFQAAVTAPDPVVFTIRALVQNSVGCGDTSTAGRVIINPLPIPVIRVTPAHVLVQPDYTFGFTDLAASNPNKIYTWDMGDRTLRQLNGQSISYTYGDTGTYKVKLQVINFETGCKATDSTLVTILHVPGYLHVPNAMCMGCSNNALRRFLPMGKGLKEYRLRVYTTWGQKIFESVSLDNNGSPNEAWDGTMNGKPLQQDAYTWQIEARYLNGTEWKGMIYPGTNKPVKTGFITIIK